MSSLFRFALPLLVSSLVMAAAPLKVKRTPFTTEEKAQIGNSKYAAKTVTANHLIFPSGIYGTKADPLDQVDEVVEKAHTLLKAQGLGIGAMLQHTIFLKNGAADTMAVLDRFHKAATKLAPSLKTERSVGTIIRLPKMPGNSMVMLDMVAGTKLSKAAGTDPDGYVRKPFVHGPQEICESVTDKQIMFTAGMEAMDFKNNKLPTTIEAQVEAVVAKLDEAFKRAGMSLAQMLQHNIYYRADIDPAVIVKKFHEELSKREPLHAKHPGVGAMQGVNGMAGDGFMLEVDAIGTSIPIKDIKSAPYTEVFMDVHKTAQAGFLAPVVDVVGVHYADGMTYPDGADAQIDLTVKNLKDFMAKGKLSLKDMVKVRLMVTPKAGDPEKIRTRFYEALYKLEPTLKQNPPAETLMYVERLDRELVFQVVPIAAK